MFCTNRDELYNKEREIVNETMVKDELCLNMVIGGSGGFFSEEHMINCSKRGNEVFLNKLLNDDDFKKRISENAKIRTKKLISEGKINVFTKENTYSWLGKNHSEETKNKISKIKKGNFLGENNSQYNTTWINKNSVNKKIKKDELHTYINDGWVMGKFVSKEELIKMNNVMEKKRKVVRPDYLTLTKEILELGYKGVGLKYGVSPRAIKKWVDHYEKYKDF
jgi:hypothetical protein